MHTHVSDTLKACFLALLLLAGGPLAPRVCADCPPADHTPAAASADLAQDACCQPPQNRDRRPDHEDTEDPRGCECPPGCCTLGFAKALATTHTGLNAGADQSAWDTPDARTRSNSGSDGPRRPPRA